jgi:hypothetical protein
MPDGVPLSVLLSCRVESVKAVLKQEYAAGIDLIYEVRGPGTACVVVVWHGFNISLSPRTLLAPAPPPPALWLFPLQCVAGDMG